MKPCGKVSSIRGANTLFLGQQINGQTHRREDKQITEDPRIRAKEPGPL
jgi:hypothetical protein